MAKMLDTRLPVRDDVKTLEYWRPPTPEEIRFGEGAIHWLTVPVKDVIHPNTRIPKRWIKVDGLRYYYPM